ncbi:MAG: hypothetical protein NTY53_21435 [Kiritimatiellaeota bacterium]|nr:hypothetical protein [Kiritimatiellota bacterium]
MNWNIFVALLLALPALGVADSPPSLAQWKYGPSASTNYFPIAVWLQDPKNAPRYKAAGFNLFVGLWEGPTEAQLAALAAAQMPVICDQNATGLKHKDDPIIVGWMHGDEPDNAQEIPGGKGYGPPISPQKIVADYVRLKAADPTRPIMLNLGQGVAWDHYYGRGVRSNHPEDYAEYIRGSDIVSFDIYPAVHEHPAVAGKLWFVPQGVGRLRQWSRDEKIVWNCIECTRIGNTKTKPTPAQVRSEVWMSLIHGSRGLIYFVHQFKPRFIEAGLFADDEMTRAVTALNRQIAELAPVLNSPALSNAVTVASSNAEVPIAYMVKQCNGATWLFAVAMRPGETTASFALKNSVTHAEVLGESRQLEIRGGKFQDAFQPYAVHLYRLTP